LLISGCGSVFAGSIWLVGELYKEEDDAGRTRAFAIFSMAINVGAFVGPLLCGLLAQIYGWHAGFGLAAALMLIGLATYLAGLKHLAEKPRETAVTTPAAQTSKDDWKIMLAIGVAAFITMFQTIGYYQNTNIGLIWINQVVDLDLFGFRIPTPWFNSIDPLASIVAVPLLIALWKWQDKNGGEPDDIAKIGIGAWMTAGANMLLVVGAATMHRVPAIVPIVYDILLGVAFLYYWPVLLALVSRTAPDKVKATLMGAIFLSLFVGNFIIGWIGGLYERVGPVTFWGIEAGISAIGGVLASVDPRLPFWLSAVACLANAAFGWFVLPESLPPERRMAFAWARANPLGSLRLLSRHAQLLGLSVANFFGQVAHQVLPSVFVLYAAYRYGWGESMVGLTLAFVGVCSAVVQGALIGPAMTWLGERRATVLGLLAGALGMAIYGLAPNGWLFWIGVPVMSLWGLSGPASLQIMTRMVGPSEQGQLAGANTALASIAGLVAPGLFAVTFAHLIGPLPGAPFLLAGLFLLLAFALAWAVTRSLAPATRKPPAGDPSR